jgi:prevent-host-death family protein
MVLYDIVHWQPRVEQEVTTVASANTETVKASEARQHFAELVNRVFKEGTRVVVEKSGIPVAALVSLRDLAYLERLDGNRAERQAILDAMREPFKDVPPDELQREIDEALAEVREEVRAGHAAKTRVA